MSLKSIIQSKDQQIQTIISNFEKEFNAMSEVLQKQLTLLFQRGIYDKETIVNLFSANGYDDIIDSVGNSYFEAIKYTKQIADEIGYKFVLTNDAIERFDLLQEISIDKMLDMKNNYANDMRSFAIQYELEGKRFRELEFKNFLNDSFATMSRRLATEAYTGIAIADRALKNDFFSGAGIELYYYDGPNDNVTRDSCRTTLSDSRQSTGWTIQEINASLTPFIECGGWNCRHEWLPFIGNKL